MELLHITGPKDDIDRVMARYLSRYDIHFENAIASLSSLSGVRPFVETNVYKDAYARARELCELLGEGGEARAAGGARKSEGASAGARGGRLKEKGAASKGNGAKKAGAGFGGQGSGMRPAEAESVVDSISELAREIRDRRDALREERIDIQGRMRQLEPFRGLDYEFRKILEFRFIAYRFGRISRDYYPKFERYVHETDHVLFYECHSDENYVWGAYFVPEVYRAKADAACMSFHFERVEMPESFEGTPDDAYAEAENQMYANIKEDEELKEKLRGVIGRHKKELLDATACLEGYCDNFDIRKMAVCTTQDAGDGDEGEEYYILYGWMEEGDARRLRDEAASDEDVHFIAEDEGESLNAGPPTRLKNPKLFKPFEMFVEMYGLPAYNEMDPTIFVALTYSFMFGVMFGDVGQGACLVIGGFLLYRLRGMNLGAIVGLSGIWSVVFGFLYGSVFGFEDWISPVWRRPMDDVMTTLIIAIAFGMVLIMVAMGINIANAVRAKEKGRLLFDQSGIAGLVCYGFCVLCIALFATGHSLPAFGILAVAVGVPLLAILFKEPLTNLVEKKSRVLPEGSKAMFLIEALVELFDVVLSYATNSISFVRVGAFALSHAGMMGVVLTLAGYESGSPNWIIVVLGNVLVMGLEGLVVGIQVLRLEYYEMFSRFYKGTGKPFVAFSKKKEMGGK